jgi:hypothetical protein
MFSAVLRHGPIRKVSCADRDSQTRCIARIHIVVAIGQLHWVRAELRLSCNRCFRDTGHDAGVEQVEVRWRQRVLLGGDAASSQELRVLRVIGSHLLG